MDMPSITTVSRQGMSYERSRLEIAAQRIALNNVAFSSEASAKEVALGVSSEFSGLIGVDNQAKGADVKRVHDPAHPMADDSGHVFYLDVDHVAEMVRMAGAVRAYEANVRAYNLNREMKASALQIGEER